MATAYRPPCGGGELGGGGFAGTGFGAGFFAGIVEGEFVDGVAVVPLFVAGAVTFRRFGSGPSFTMMWRIAPGAGAAPLAGGVVVPGEGGRTAGVEATRGTGGPAEPELAGFLGVACCTVLGAEVAPTADGTAVEFRGVCGLGCPFEPDTNGAVAGFLGIACGPVFCAELEPPVAADPAGFGLTIAGLTGVPVPIFVGLLASTAAFLGAVPVVVAGLGLAAVALVDGRAPAVPASVDRAPDVVGDFAAAACAPPEAGVTSFGTTGAGFGITGAGAASAPV